MTTFQDVVSFVLEASDAELEGVQRALKTRKEAVAAARAARIVEGMKVTTMGLRPAYINDLVGTVVSVNGNRVSIKLDATSAYMVAGRKYRANADGNFSGIPITCLRPTP